MANMFSFGNRFKSTERQANNMLNKGEVSLNLLDSNDMDTTSSKTIVNSAPDISAVSTMGDIDPQPLESSASTEELGLEHGIELRWSDLSYHAKTGSLNPFSSKKDKTVIHNLNGSIRNGQLTAIIGPSGAGKTTLIECLSGRRINGVTGDVTVVYNG